MAITRKQGSQRTQGEGQAPPSGQHGSSVALAPRISTRTMSALESIPTDVLFNIGLHLHLHDWLNLRLVSRTCFTLEQDCATPFRGRALLSEINFLKVMNLPSGPLKHCERLKLGKGILNADLEGVVNALLDSRTTWRHLELDFEGLEYTDVPAYVSLAQALFAALSKEHAGAPAPTLDVSWPKSIGMKLSCYGPHKSSLAQLLATLADASWVDAFEISCTADEEYLKFIEKVKVLKRLDLDLGDLPNNWRALKKTLRASHAKIHELALNGLSGGVSLDTLIPTLTGKEIRSVEVNPSREAQYPKRFHFAKWQALQTERLSLAAQAESEDGPELQAMLRASLTLQILELSGLGFQHLHSDLVKGLQLNSSLKELHLHCPPPGQGDTIDLIDAVLAHPVMEYACIALYDPALVEACSKLPSSVNGCRIEFKALPWYAPNLSTELQAEAASKLQALIQKYCPGGQDEQSEDGEGMGCKCNSM